MKKIIILILVAGWALTSYSQNVIQLEETRLNFDPSAEIVFEDYDNGIVKVKEKYAEQFEANTIAFLKENFDFTRFIDGLQGSKRDIIITAKSSKGFITATYNQDGEIIKNYQIFKNIALPYDIRNQVYSQYMGWTITSNKYVASGKRDKIDNQKYAVKLQKGKEKKKLKLTPGVSVTGVASIEQ